MDIVLNISAAGDTGSIFAPLVAMWVIIVHGGWVVLAYAFLHGFWWMWITWRKNVYDESIKHILLAIDVPKENEQTPKAVENIFSHMHGIYKKGDLIQRFIQGYNMQGFSLEIISIGGYIQFLIRTPIKQRDMVEAAIYAQYPDAEITEVEDYTKNFKVQFPNDSYDVWGSEYKLAKKDVYPIKTYIAFEDPSTKETFKDPMASFLEIMSRLQTGEQLWFQIVISPPVDDKWREKGIRIIKKLIGAKSAKGRDITWLPTQVGHGLFESFTASIIPPSELAGSSGSKELLKWPTLMQHLTPAERSVVEAIGIKISKIAYESKIRIIYLAPKAIFNRGRIIPAVEGALKQFNTLDLNGIKRDKKTKTKVTYPAIKPINEWRQNNRKRRIMWGYKYRSGRRGGINSFLTSRNWPRYIIFRLSRSRPRWLKRLKPRKANHRSPCRLRRKSIRLNQRKFTKKMR